MENKLNRGKIIKKYIGEGLSDLGFVYEKYEGDTWFYAKKLGKLTWYVYIYVYRFDPWQVTFHLGTDVPGVALRFINRNNKARQYAPKSLSGIYNRFVKNKIIISLRTYAYDASGNRSHLREGNL